MSPLYVACENGHKLTVKLLLERGANPNLTGTVSFVNSHSIRLREGLL